MFEDQQTFFSLEFSTSLAFDGFGYIDFIGNLDVHWPDVHKCLQKRISHIFDKMNINTGWSNHARCDFQQW